MAVKRLNKSNRSKKKHNTHKRKHFNRKNVKKHTKKRTMKGGKDSQLPANQPQPTDEGEDEENEQETNKFPGPGTPVGGNVNSFEGNINPTANNTEYHEVGPATSKITGNGNMF